MLFNSWTFLAFFGVVYPLYLVLGRWHRTQNAFLLAASCVFYGAWNWKFLFLLALTSGVDFFVAQAIHASSDRVRRKRLLVVSIAVNLVVLGFFKYFDFFARSAAELLALFGMKADPFTLGVVLPVGISFYTFQAMSYVIDVYRGDLEPTRSGLDYGLFIAFFPHLVAGPIQRPNILLPQVARRRRITSSQIYSGVFLVAWGFWKKMVIADNMALIANPIFDGWRTQTSGDLLVGALAFTFQIYGDFSGYSDIARGLSKLMGFDLMVNFRLPYFATTPSDFWQRWHVSLSTWLRDYLYVSLGGNRGTTLFTYRNLVLTMLLGGLWHGAAWNFVLWGAYHGLLLVVYRPVQAALAARELPRWVSPATWPLRVGLMFALTVVGWVLFRSKSWGQSVYMVSHLGLTPGPATFESLRKLVFFTAPLLVVQAAQYATNDLLVLPRRLHPALLGLVYALLAAAITVFGVRQSMEFIYFQF